VRRCIYCNAGTYEPDTTRRLADEHIIPEGLGGHLLLPESSCRSCEAITSGFEGACLRRLFGAMRVFLNMPSKRPKDRPTTIPVIVNATHAQDGVWADAPAHMYPVAVALVQFQAPVLLGGPIGNRSYDAVKLHLLLSPLDLDRRVKEIERYLNVQNVQVGWHLSFEILRLIAKIAHSYLTAEIGHGNFAPLLLPSIRSYDHDEITRFVGQMDANEDRTVSGHVLSHEEVGIDSRQYHLVRVRLFGAYGLPEFVAVTGEVL
jgi:hypothetical protein